MFASLIAKINVSFPSPGIMIHYSHYRVLSHLKVSSSDLDTGERVSEELAGFCETGTRQGGDWVCGEI